MRNPYLLGFTILHTIGLKKTSARLARYLEQYSREPLKSSKLYEAIWEFTRHVQSVPLCLGDFGCSFPILSNNDSFHRSCRQAQADEDARIAADEAEADAYLDSRCKQLGCWEDAVKDGYCQSDWDYNYLCGEPGCDKLESECGGSCVQDIDEMSDEFPSDQDDQCPGGCGQPAYACVCAELKSYRDFHANPETRGSYWTA